MPRRRLPPLSALPSFEAAARHLSFSKAAAELCVTHGAVSHAVRNLEDQLGVQLMVRATRSVRLTPTGASFAAEVRDALERLADFTSDGIDIAIRCGGGRYPGLAADLLMKEDHSPVCSPKLLKGRHPLRTPANLARHTLLHDVFTVDWAIWLRSAGIDGIDPHLGPTFLSSDHAIQAAIRGEGVVLGRSALVADELAAGRLVRPFKLSLPAGFAYYVVCPPRALKRPNVKAFRDWLVAEASDQRATGAPAVPSSVAPGRH